MDTKPSKKIIIINSIVAAILLAGVLYLYDMYAPGRTQPVIQSATSQENQASSTSARLSLIVVSTDADMEHGLGDRASLPADQGMLFVFPAPDSYGIWMKDMQFSIDIISLDSDFRIVNIEQNVSPQSYPKVFYSPATTHYIIETNAGYAEKNNLKVGGVVDVARSAVNK